MGKKAAEKKEEPKPKVAEAVDEGPLDEETAKDLAQYDLLPRITPFLDRHFVINMLNDARICGIYKAEDVTRAVLDVCYETLLPHDDVLGWVEEMYTNISEPVPAKWEEHKETLLESFQESEDKVMPLLKILEEEKKVEKIQGFKSRAEMCDEFEIGPDVVEELPRYAKKLFDAGRYDVSLKLLKYYMNMPQAGTAFFVIQHLGSGELEGERFSSEEDAEKVYKRYEGELRAEQGKQEKGAADASKAVLLTDNDFAERLFFGRNRDRILDMRVWWEKEQARKQAVDEAGDRQLIWGSLAAAILWGSSDACDEAVAESAKMIVKMDEHLENSKAPKREVLLHRTWLLHWTLFAIFRLDNTEAKVLDFFLSEKSLSIISLSCPHLFRYVGACLILHKRLKHIVKDTVWIIHHEAVSYSDPITRFLLALYTEMDYDEAQGELQRCEQVCKADYFLKPHWQEFQENARLHIFESYCRIHQCINIQMIAEKLNMEAEEAELWIVKLIQNAKLDARIDSEKSRVVMTKAPPNVYQQVIEKTKNLAFRSTMLVSNLEKS